LTSLAPPPGADADRVTCGLVCAHHHLYSSLARGMPAPPSRPADFIGVLRNVWWRLDAALDLDILHWSAALGAAEAVLSGTTAIIDHHESPNAIEGSLDAIKSGCDRVGVRSILSYGVTDRWADDGTLSETVSPTTPMTDGARRGLEECARHAATGGATMVGVHAAFTCGNETLNAAADLAERLGTGVHIHVAEGPDDVAAADRIRDLADEDWLLVHCVLLDEELPGTVVHNPRSNMNNAVGYARPARWSNRVALGTDGIGADMLDEARLAFARLRESDLGAVPDLPWTWLAAGADLVPEVRNDSVVWSAPAMTDPWRAAYTTGIHAEEVRIDGRVLVSDGRATGFDMEEITAKATEAAARLHARL
jgi:cytosine/adenosine deaminase-related metal-dependent hydrolase